MKKRQVWDSFEQLPSNSPKFLTCPSFLLLLLRHHNISSINSPLIWLSSTNNRTIFHHLLPLELFNFNIKLNSSRVIITNRLLRVHFQVCLPPRLTPRHRLRETVARPQEIYLRNSSSNNSLISSRLAATWAQRRSSCARLSNNHSKCCSMGWPSATRRLFLSRITSRIRRLHQAIAQEVIAARNTIKMHQTRETSTVRYSSKSSWSSKRLIRQATGVACTNTTITKVDGNWFSSELKVQKNISSSLSLQTPQRVDNECNNRGRKLRQVAWLILGLNCEFILRLMTTFKSFEAAWETSSRTLLPIKPPSRSKWLHLQLL